MGLEARVWGVGGWCDQNSFSVLNSEEKNLLRLSPGSPVSEVIPRTQQACLGLGRSEASALLTLVVGFLAVTAILLMLESLFASDASWGVFHLALGPGA